MGKSSKDKRDIYYRLAKENGWRARSAFKLLHIQEEFNIFDGVRKAVDLCAAPGSWSQVLSQCLPSSCPDCRIVAIDLQPMAPVPGVEQIQGDITNVETAHQVVDLFVGEKADLVICDGAPDVTGLHDLDEYLQAQLVVAALNITTYVLTQGGSFLAKIFRGKDTDILCSQLGTLFKRVHVVKPKSSRHSSVECFVLCRDFSPPDGFRPSMDNPLMCSDQWNFDELDCVNRKTAPFVTCGDLSGYDSDMSYPLEDANKAYQPREVVQSPIEPAYHQACVLKKRGLLRK